MMLASGIDGLLPKYPFRLPECVLLSMAAQTDIVWPQAIEM